MYCVFGIQSNLDGLFGSRLYFLSIGKLGFDWLNLILFHSTNLVSVFPKRWIWYSNGSHLIYQYLWISWDSIRTIELNPLGVRGVKETILAALVGILSLQCIGWI